MLVSPVSSERWVRGCGGLSLLHPLASLQLYPVEEDACTQGYTAPSLFFMV